MNIILPTKNLRTKDFLIKDGILYLRYGQSFQNAIYSLTYFMKGKRFCYYCKKSFPRNEITMDHMYPRSTGGPTIPQNLIPSCKGCNSKKKDMTFEQYQHFLAISSDIGRKMYLAKVSSFKEGIKAIGMFEIPNNWITPVKVDAIHTQIDLSDISEQKLKKAISYYQQHHQFQKAIILDRNFFSLDGLYVLLVAKSCEVEYVPAIVLENVEVRQNRNIKISKR